MKKIFYSLMTVAALLSAASCQKEFTNSPDPAYGGKPVVTTFNVDLGVTTKALESSALDDGTTVNKLYVAAYGSDGKLVSTSLVGNNAAAISNKTATVKLTLSKGQSYDIVFFAMYDGAYSVDFSDGPKATFSYKTSGLKANDPQLDAFYKKISVASASTTTESVTLKRPFAQINVLSSNAPEGTISSSMTVKGVPTTFDLFNEAAGTETTDLAFGDNAISAAAFGKYANDYTWLAMNFVLPNQAGLVELSFQATQMTDAVTVKNVAVKKNGRTNLIGAIYDLDATITYNVTVDPIFENEGEAGLDDEDTEITVADGSSYTANNPLVIDASNGANPVSVTLNVNGGDSFNTIETGAAGGVIEAETSDDKVATAEVDKTNNAVKITPVGNGDAVITVTTPRYTKAFSAGSIEIHVQVTGIAAPAVDPELSVSGFPTAATSAPFTVSLTNNSDGELTITVNPDGAATVEAGTTAGVYTVTPAEFESNTEVTVTFATAATAAFNAGEVVGTFTIAGSGGGDEPPTGGTIADVKEAIGDATSSKTFDAITLGSVTVTGVNGGQAYMEDETGGIQLYLSGHTLERGKSYTGAVVTKGLVKNDAFQIEDFDISNAVVADATLPAKTLAVSAIDFAQHESQRVKIEGVTFAAEATGSKKTVNVSQGTDVIGVRVMPALESSIAAGSVADVYGVVTIFNGAAQITVFAAEDIVVTGQGDQTAVISGMPGTKSLAASESFDFSSVVTTNSTAAVTYAITSGSNVVTLSGSTVTVKADAAAGATAVITASVAATDGYTAAEDVTCTITVKDSSTPSGDPTVITKTMKEIQEGNKYTVSAGTDVTCYKTFSLDSNITVSTSGDDNCGSFWAAGSDIQWRLYQNKTGDVTITAAKGTIQSVKITYAVTNTGTLKNGTAIVESGVAQDVNASSVTYTVGNTATANNGQVRITAIEVTYE